MLQRNIIRNIITRSEILTKRESTLNISRNILTSSKRQFSSSTLSLLQHKGNFRTSDSTIESEEIVTDNNPWSPTLYNDIVYVRKTGSFRSSPLPDNYRLSYQSLYEAPGAKYVAMLKRISLSFAVLGIYGAKLFYESSQFDDIYAALLLLTTSTPALFIQYKTKDYVTRIFRLYDKEKPQTLENLTSDEQLIMEKLNPTGSRTFNQLLKVDNDLVLLKELKWYTPYTSWEDKEGRKFFIVDNIGGLRVDRLWGIVEKNSGVNNGRYLEEIPNSNN